MTLARRTPCVSSVALIAALLVLSFGANACAATTLTSTLTTTSAASALRTTATDPNAPVPVPASDLPYPGRRLSPDAVIAIAARLAKVRHARAQYPGSYGGAYLKGPGRWQVSYFSRQGKEIAQVYISDSSGRVLEQWTGFQVAWTMARGYPGAFGRHVNALYVWLPLCLLFMLPFVNWRRPFSLLHLDLLVLLSLSISLAFFNHANIYASVPAAYPPLVYLLARMLAIARPRLRRLRRRRPEGDASPELDVVTGAGASVEPASREAPPLRLLVPAPWLAVGVVFLLGFRIGLNVTDSNVIDVGYAGVIGADKIVHGKALYGSWPKDNEHGDTYGPVNYAVYVPFRAVFGWSGGWDDLPAAHGAAIFFDLLTVALLFLLGRRVRGPTLGVALAYAWVAYPFTLFALESNSNDALVGALVLAALYFATSPPVRGIFAALAGLTKLAPLALAPLLATHGLRELPSVARRARALVLFLLAFAFTVAVAAIPALRHDSLHTIYERTFAYQADRGSPFSIWGLYGLRGWETAVEVATVALALTLAVLPRRGDAIGLAAAAAAILIATQLGIEHWFYLYIPWFFGAAMLALLGGFGDGRPASGLLASSSSAPRYQENAPLAAAASTAGHLPHSGHAAGRP